MGKYIDAEQLKAKIIRLKGQLIRGACAAQIEMETNCKDEAYDEVLASIDSLQQEPPECIYGRTLEEREKSCKYCSARCGARIEQEQPEVNTEYIRKDMVINAIKLAFGKVSMNPFDCQEAFEELLDKLVGEYDFDRVNF